WVVLSYRRCRSGRAASDPEASNLEQVLVQITSAGPLPKTVPGSVPVVLPGHRDSAPSRYRDVPSSVPLRSVHGGITGGKTRRAVGGVGDDARRRLRLGR